MPKQTQKNACGALFNGVVENAIKNGAECVPKPYEIAELSPVFEDEDLVETCFALIANNLNVSRTAAQLYMHRNTLIYRIAKLKRLTGLKVTNFGDAITFVILYRTYLNGRSL